jgi:hypothetical protein
LEEVTDAYDSVRNSFQALEQRLSKKQAIVVSEDQTMRECKTNLNQIKTQLVMQQKQDK